MEAFESFVAVALEAEGLVVSSAVKFPVRIETARGPQTHGFEVDLVGARGDRLVLASVKSFLGSAGVQADAVLATGAFSRQREKHYAMLNDKVLRNAIVRAAAKQYGYKVPQVHLRLYAGKFAGSKGGLHERRIRTWAARQRVGAGPIEVFGLRDIIAEVLKAAEKKQYRDNPVLVTLKALQVMGVLTRTSSVEIADQLASLDIA